jgi:hypothetical protein
MSANNRKQSAEPLARQKLVSRNEASTYNIQDL